MFHSDWFYVQRSPNNRHASKHHLFLCHRNHALNLVKMGSSMSKEDSSVGAEVRGFEARDPTKIEGHRANRFESESQTLQTHAI